MGKSLLERYMDTIEEMSETIEQKDFEIQKLKAEKEALQILLQYESNKIITCLWSLS